MAFFTKEELNNIGLKSLGDNVLISKLSSIYNPQNISIGSNVRIDDFCIISAGCGGIEIGNYCHIACYVSLIGKAKIKIGNYSSISSKSSIYSSTDDYSGLYLIGPTVDEKYRNVVSGDVILDDDVIIGASCVILPNVTIHNNVAIGAMSLVTKNIPSNEVWVGIPAKKIKNREKYVGTRCS